MKIGNFGLVKPCKTVQLFIFYPKVDFICRLTFLNTIWFDGRRWKRRKRLRGVRQVPAVVRPGEVVPRGVVVVLVVALVVVVYRV